MAPARASGSPPKGANQPSTTPRSPAQSDTSDESDDDKKNPYMKGVVLGEKNRMKTLRGEVQAQRAELAELEAAQFAAWKNRANAKKLAHDHDAIFKEGKIAKFIQQTYERAVASREDADKPADAWAAVREARELASVIVQSLQKANAAASEEESPDSSNKRDANDRDANNKDANDRDANDRDANDRDDDNGGAGKGGAGKGGAKKGDVSNGGSNNGGDNNGDGNNGDAKDEDEDVSPSSQSRGNTSSQGIANTHVSHRSHVHGGGDASPAPHNNKRVSPRSHVHGGGDASPAPHNNKRVSPRSQAPGEGDASPAPRNINNFVSPRSQAPGGGDASPAPRNTNNFVSPRSQPGPGPGQQAPPGAFAQGNNGGNGGEILQDFQGNPQGQLGVSHAQQIQGNPQGHFGVSHDQQIQGNPQGDFGVSHDQQIHAQYFQGNPNGNGQYFPNGGEDAGAFEGGGQFFPNGMTGVPQYHNFGGNAPLRRASDADYEDEGFGGASEIESENGDLFNNTTVDPDELLYHNLVQENANMA